VSRGARPGTACRLSRHPWREPGRVSPAAHRLGLPLARCSRRGRRTGSSTGRRLARGLEPGCARCCHELPRSSQPGLRRSFPRATRQGFRGGAPDSGRNVLARERHARRRLRRLQPDRGGCVGRLVRIKQGNHPPAVRGPLRAQQPPAGHSVAESAARQGGGRRRPVAQRHGHGRGHPRHTGRSRRGTG
jgi:hypothetical protein